MASCSSATHCSRCFYRTSSRDFIFPTISQCLTEDASLEFLGHLFQLPALDGLWLSVVSFIHLSTFNKNKRTHTVMCLPWPRLLKRTAHRFANFTRTSRRRYKNTSYESEFFCLFCELGSCISCFLLLLKGHDIIFFFFSRLAHILCRGETKVHARNSNKNYTKWKLLHF